MLLARYDYMSQKSKNKILLRSFIRSLLSLFFIFIFTLPTLAALKINYSNLLAFPDKLIAQNIEEEKQEIEKQEIEKQESQEEVPEEKSTDVQDDSGADPDSFDSGSLNNPSNETELLLPSQIEPEEISVSSEAKPIPTCNNNNEPVCTGNLIPSCDESPNATSIGCNLSGEAECYAFNGSIFKSVGTPTCKPNTRNRSKARILFQEVGILSLTSPNRAYC